MRSARAAATFALALIALLASGCEGGDQPEQATAAADAAAVKVAGLDFALPEGAETEPTGAATVAALLSQSAYLPRLVDCYSKALAKAPADQTDPLASLPEEERPAAQFALAMRLGSSCVGRNETVVEAGATPEQLTRFRELSSSQFASFLAGQGATEKQAACVLGYYRQMSDERLVAWTNGPAPQQRSSLLNWAGRCQQVTQVIAPPAG